MFITTYFFLHLIIFLQRIDILVKQNRYKDSLRLAQSFFEGKAKAVVGLLGGAQKRRKSVSNMVKKICLSLYTVTQSTILYVACTVKLH